MNKRILLLATLIGLAPVLHVAASAESMYKDLVECVIAPDGKLEASKLHRVEEARHRLMLELYSLRNEVTWRYAQRYPKSYDLGFMGIMGVGGTIFGLLSCYEYCTLKPYHTGQRLGASLAFTSLCLGSFIVLAVANYVEIKLCTNKIREIAAVLVKLDVLKAQLRTELNLFAEQGIAIEQAQ